MQVIVAWIEPVKPLVTCLCQGPKGLDAAPDDQVGGAKKATIDRPGCQLPLSATSLKVATGAKVKALWLWADLGGDRKNEDMGFDCLDLAVTRKVTLDKFSFIFKPIFSQKNRLQNQYVLAPANDVPISYLEEELARSGRKKEKKRTKVFVIHWPAMMMISCLVILSCSALLTYTASSPTLMRLWCRTCIKPGPIFQIFSLFPPKNSAQPLVEM